MRVDRDIECDRLFLNAFPRVHTNNGGKDESTDGEPVRTRRCLISPARRLDRETRQSIPRCHDDARLVYLRVRTKERFEHMVDERFEGRIACPGEALYERFIHGSIVNRIGQVV